MRQRNITKQHYWPIYILNYQLILLTHT